MDDIQELLIQHWRLIRRQKCHPPVVASRLCGSEKRMMSATISPAIEILRFIAVPVSFILVFAAAKILTIWTYHSLELTYLTCLIGTYLAVRFPPMLAPRGKLLCSLLLGSLFVFSALYRQLVYRPHGDSIDLWSLVILLALAWYQVFRAERGARSRSDAT